MTDHGLDRASIVPAGGVLRAIGLDEKHDLLRPLGLVHRGQPLAGGDDGRAHRVVERGQAARHIGGPVQVTDLAQLDRVQVDLVLVVELDEAEHGRACDLLLLVDKAVEGADHLVAQAAHGTGPVKDHGDIAAAVLHCSLLGFWGCGAFLTPTLPHLVGQIASDQKINRRAETIVCFGAPERCDRAARPSIFLAIPAGRG